MLTSSAACERNKAPILEVLRVRFADRSQVLEVGSGTGQHAVHFARLLSHLIWHPTEQLTYLGDLAERVKLEGSPNLRAPVQLDVRQSLWPLRSVDAVFTANTLHIMSWTEVEFFFNGVGTILAPGGVLCIYGPFKYRGRHTSPSNHEFDQMLQERDPASGLRDLVAVNALAAQYGLRLDEDYEMPANNRLLAFLKEPS